MLPGVAVKDRPFSLGTRLALAFGALFLAVSCLAAVLAAWRAGRSVEELHHQRMIALVQAIPASFVNNPEVLARTRRLVGADVAVFDPASRELVSSLAPADQEWLAHCLAKEAPKSLVPGPVAMRRPESGPPGVPVVEFRAFGAWQGDAGSRRVVLLIVPQAEIDRAKTAAVAPILWTALAGAVAAALLGFLLASTVSRPLKRLAAEAGRAAGGERSFQASSGGGREVEALGQSVEQMSKALLAAREEMVRSERMAVAGQMAAALAHEVRNPLTSAKMTVELLLSDEKRPEAAETLRTVLEELARLELVVDEMVSFARPTPPVLARVDLPAVAGEVLAFMRRQLEHAHVKATTDFDAAAPAARADRNKVKQVLVNLVLNAMQAQPRGGEVAVRLRPAAGGERLELEVSDQGPGVPAAELDKIFAPFYTTKSGGAGLGLSVSRRIAEQHGGTLECEPGGDGRGATFRLSLPAWKEG